MGKRLMSAFLTLCLAFSFLPAATAVAFADSGESVFVKQEERGKCTLASATMLLRQTAIANGEKNWDKITQKSVRPTVWLEGVGLLHSFTYQGIKVSYKDLNVQDKTAALIDLLDQHPEGIIIYIRSIPHAVLLTRYDKSGGIFYCADPALSANEMTLEDSWLRNAKNGGSQSGIVNAVDCYWYVSSVNYVMLDGTPADSTSQSQGNVGGDSSQVQIPQTTTPAAGAPQLETPEQSGQDELASITSPNGSEQVQFSKIEAYKGFGDVSTTAWYYEYVKTAFELGLMNGDGVDFNPDGNVTVGQTITMAARIHSLYYKNGYDFTVSAGQAWYQPYVDYAYENGIIGDKYYNANMDAMAARLEFADILNKAMPSTALSEINYAAAGLLPDVSAVSDGGKAVYKLYRAGVLTGSDDGRFYPANSISRAEAAAVITRMTDSTQRIRN